jgi:hypothetical protein
MYFDTLIQTVIPVVDATEISEVLGILVVAAG